MDRNANCAGLIGNRPGNGLANPPGGVGRKLVSAAIFVLVDRPHQARVPLLNEVQEAHPPIAVFLGDRDHQPQVSARELPLDLLVVLILAAHDLAALAQAFGRLLGQDHQVAEFAAQIRPLVARGRIVEHVPQPAADFVHPGQRVFHLPHHRLHAPRAQAQLFDQREHLAPAADEPLSRGGCARRGDVRLFNNLAKVAAVLRLPSD